METISKNSSKVMNWIISDGNGSETIACSESNLEKKINNWVKSGDNVSDSTSTYWINVYVTNTKNKWLGPGRIKVQIDPNPPSCELGMKHDWQAPYEIVGGIKENPGVWGHGGGVIIKEVCLNCMCKKTTDTWAQDPETGEQGLTSIKYDSDYYE